MSDNQKKRGHWELHILSYGAYVVCSECGERHSDRTPYCPWCGSHNDFFGECDSCYHAQNENLEDDDSVCKECGYGEDKV